MPLPRNNQNQAGSRQPTQSQKTHDGPTTRRGKGSHRSALPTPRSRRPNNSNNMTVSSDDHSEISEENSESEIDHIGRRDRDRNYSQVDLNEAKTNMRLSQGNSRASSSLGRRDQEDGAHRVSDNLSLPPAAVANETAIAAYKRKIGFILSEAMRRARQAIEKAEANQRSVVDCPFCYDSFSQETFSGSHLGDELGRLTVGMLERCQVLPAPDRNYLENHVASSTITNTTPPEQPSPHHNIKSTTTRSQSHSLARSQELVHKRQSITHPVKPQDQSPGSQSQQPAPLSDSSTLQTKPLSHREIYPPLQCWTESIDIQALTKYYPNLANLPLEELEKHLYCLCCQTLVNKFHETHLFSHQAYDGFRGLSQGTLIKCNECRLCHPPSATGRHKRSLTHLHCVDALKWSHDVAQAYLIEIDKPIRDRYLACLNQTDGKTNESGDIEDENEEDEDEDDDEDDSDGEANDEDDSDGEANEESEVAGTLLELFMPRLKQSASTNPSPNTNNQKHNLNNTNIAEIHPTLDSQLDFLCDYGRHPPQSQFQIFDFSPDILDVNVKAIIEAKNGGTDYIIHLCSAFPTPSERNLLFDTAFWTKYFPFYCVFCGVTLPKTEIESHHASHLRYFKRYVEDNCEASNKCCDFCCLEMASDDDHSSHGRKRFHYQIVSQYYTLRLQCPDAPTEGRIIKQLVARHEIRARAWLYIKEQHQQTLDKQKMLTIEYCCDSALRTLHLALSALISESSQEDTKHDLVQSFGTLLTHKTASGKRAAKVFGLQYAEKLAIQRRVARDSQ